MTKELELAAQQTFDLYWQLQEKVNKNSSGPAFEHAQPQIIGAILTLATEFRRLAEPPPKKHQPLASHTGLSTSGDQ